MDWTDGRFYMESDGKSGDNYNIGHTYCMELHIHVLKQINYTIKSCHIYIYTTTVGPVAPQSVSGDVCWKPITPASIITLGTLGVSGSRFLGRELVVEE